MSKFLTWHWGPTPIESIPTLPVQFHTPTLAIAPGATLKKACRAQVLFFSRLKNVKAEGLGHIIPCRTAFNKLPFRMLSWIFPELLLRDVTLFATGLVSPVWSPMWKLSLNDRLESFTSHGDLVCVLFPRNEILGAQMGFSFHFALKYRAQL